MSLTASTTTHIKMHPIRLHINIYHIYKDSFHVKLICLCICYSYIHLKKSLIEFFLTCLSIKSKKTSSYILTLFYEHSITSCVYMIDQTIKKCYLFSRLLVASMPAYRCPYIQHTSCFLFILLIGLLKMTLQWQNYILLDIIIILGFLP